MGKAGMAPGRVRPLSGPVRTLNATTEARIPSGLATERQGLCSRRDRQRCAGCVRMRWNAGVQRRQIEAIDCRRECAMELHPVGCSPAGRLLCLASDLPPKHLQWIVVFVGHPFLQRDNRIVCNVYLLRADVLTAMGDVAVSDASLRVQERPPR